MAKAASLLWVLVFSLLTGAVAEARVRAVRGRLESARRILWIAAHPDDEALIAPFLAKTCLEGGASCTFLVLTRGESGTCALPSGCSGDLGAIRSAEAQRAASLLNAELILWDLPDVDSDQVSRIWEEHSINRETLVARVREVIDREPRDLILTFDPRHGSTCHRAHRLTGELVTEAVARRTTTAPVVFVQTAVSMNGTTFAFSPAVNGAGIFDASAHWNHLLENVEAHASQFGAEQVEALRQVPAEMQRLWYQPAMYSGTTSLLLHCP